MRFNPLKSSDEKADEEFNRAYEKGVNLGRSKWMDASKAFGDASKHYSETGNLDKANESGALAWLFRALVTGNPADWSQCSQAMRVIGDLTLNVGFPAKASDIEKQCIIIAREIHLANQFSNTQTIEGKETAANYRDLAQRYLELIGTDLVISKLQNESIDPQRRAYYLLGLASLADANATVDSDPKRSSELLSEAIAQLDLAGEDPWKIRGSVLNQRYNTMKLAKCWFCGREVQGLGSHYVSLRAEISAYLKNKYGSELPSPIEDGNKVVACTVCYSSVKYVADSVAESYYNRAIDELQATEARLNERIEQLESRLRMVRTST